MTTKASKLGLFVNVRFGTLDIAVAVACLNHQAGQTSEGTRVNCHQCHTIRKLEEEGQSIAEVGEGALHLVGLSADDGSCT
jgi:hypothetical protein